MKKQNVPDRVNDEVFIAMSKAELLTRTSLDRGVTALNRFLQEGTAAGWPSWTVPNTRPATLWWLSSRGAGR